MMMIILKGACSVELYIIIINGMKWMRLGTRGTSRKLGLCIVGGCEGSNYYDSMMPFVFVLNLILVLISISTTTIICLWNQAFWLAHSDPPLSSFLSLSIFSSLKFPHHLHFTLLYYYYCFCFQTWRIINNIIVWLQALLFFCNSIILAINYSAIFSLLIWHLVIHNS